MKHLRKLIKRLLILKNKVRQLAIKADELAAGKGVIGDDETSSEAVEDVVGNQRFGDSSSVLLWREFLDGEEFSFAPSFVHKAELPNGRAQDHSVHMMAIKDQIQVEWVLIHQYHKFLRTL